VTATGKGIALGCVAYCCLAVEMALVHLIGGQVGTFQIALLRRIGGFLLIGAVSAATGRIAVRSSAPRIQITRSLLSGSGFLAYLYAFANLPLIDATALAYTSGIFLALFGAALGEAVSLRRWLGIAAGMVGALLVIRPAFAHPSAAYFVALAAPALHAASVATSKAAIRADTVDTTMWWQGFANVPLALPGLVLPWHVEAWMLPVLVAIMVLGSLGTYLTLWAVRFADVSALAPFDYTRLIVIVLAGLVLFREFPNAWVWCGMAAILGGCLLQRGLSATTGDRDAGVRELP
jgi:drug/metabolite transporter (DMT)-like permease